jgi:ABC-2 type transport system ATP-binding protein
MATTSIIKLKGITKKFGKKTVLDNINLEINKGEIFGIIGMSGSGKTTLLNTLIGFYQPNGGDVLFYSDRDKTYKSIFRSALESRKIFGFAPQFPSFYPKLTVEENLSHFGALYHLPNEIIKANTDHLLKLTELIHERDQLSLHLSGGMQKRLSIACSLIHKPGVLILDEPTADLDPVCRKDMWHLLKGIHSIGTTIILASHLLSELEETCDRVAILHDSKIIKIGTVEQLKNTFSQDKEIQIISTPGKYERISSALSNAPSLSIRKIIVKDKRLIITTAKIEKTIQYLLKVTKRLNESILYLVAEKPSLSEIFETISHSKNKKVELR